MSRSLRVVAVPRDPNPYQELLYGALRRRGVVVRYGACLTRSHTANLLLMPVELLFRRLAGYRILHLHWVFGFTFPGSGRSRLIKRLSRVWFTAMLDVARLLGMRIVWTAHNVLPHSPVFDDDRRARRALVRRCALVIAHNAAAIDEVTALGVRPHASCVIPHGPMVDAGRFVGLTAPGGASTRTLLFLGNIAPYKGVEDLLVAARELPAPVRVVVAGECRDESQRETLERLAELAGSHVELRVGFVADDSLPDLFARADACVFPYRAVTTSGSVLLAMAAGRPILVPDLPAFMELPSAAVLCHPPGVSGLRRGIEAIASLPTAELKAMGDAARAYVDSLSWSDLAARTERCLREAAKVSER